MFILEAAESLRNCLRPSATKQVSILCKIVCTTRNMQGILITLQTWRESPLKMAAEDAKMGNLLNISALQRELHIFSCFKDNDFQGLGTTVDTVEAVHAEAQLLLESMYEGLKQTVLSHFKTCMTDLQGVMPQHGKIAYWGDGLLDKPWDDVVSVAREKVLNLNGDASDASLKKAIQDSVVLLL